VLHRTASFKLQRPALLRLEDVGPGGSYQTLEGLGKLRAVFEFLQAEQVPFHVALIPRWIELKTDGSWHDKSIDDLYPDEYVQRFVGLMNDIQQKGTLLGMHGYTHQYGNRMMPDDNQNTATGFEFHVEGEPATDTALYAWDRITRSLMAFQKAGLHPSFWESPHYVHTLEQEKVFELFSRVIYQSDVRQRAADDIFVTESGNVFIPTPLSYIHEQHSVDQVLSELSEFQGLASMFYHPFLEFPVLEIVKNPSGEAAMRRGLPVYRYTAGKLSHLQRLITEFRKKGYTWVSFRRVLP
jgi:hypothetical protein